MEEEKKKKRSPGDFYLPKDSPARAYFDDERNYFLNIAAYEEPKFLEDVVHKILPLFKKRFEDENKELSWAIIKREGKYNDLENAINEIKEKHNLLEAEWCTRDWVSELLLMEVSFRVINYSSSIDYNFADFFEDNKELSKDIQKNIGPLLEKYEKISWPDIKNNEEYDDLKAAINEMKEKYNLIEAEWCERDWVSELFFREAYIKDRKLSKSITFKTTDLVKDTKKYTMLLKNIYEKIAPILKKYNKKISWTDIKNNEEYDDLEAAINDIKEEHDLIEADWCEVDWVSELILEEAYSKVRGLSNRIPFKDISLHSDPEGYHELFKNTYEDILTINIEKSFVCDPVSNRRGEIRDRIIEEIKESINKQLDEIYEKLEEKGFRKVEPIKDMHRIFVLYQVKEMTLNEILNLRAEEIYSEGKYLDDVDEATTKSSLSEANTKIADRIGIKKR